MIILFKQLYSRSKKSTLNYFNTNYRLEMKLVSIIMDYCLLQFDALNFFLGIRLHGGESLPNFNFFNVSPQIFQQNCKVYLPNCPALYINLKVCICIFYYQFLKCLIKSRL